MEALKIEREKLAVTFERGYRHIIRSVALMGENDMKREWMALLSNAKDLNSANDNYEVGLRAKASQEPEAGNSQLLQDITNAAEESAQKVEQVGHVIKANMWTRFAGIKLSSAIRRAERSHEGAKRISLEEATHDICKERSTLTENLIIKARSLLSSWEEWIPVVEACSTRKSLEELEDKRDELWEKCVTEFGRIEKKNTDKMADKAAAAKQIATDALAEDERKRADALAEEEAKDRTTDKENKEAIAKLERKAAEARLRSADSVAEFEKETAKVKLEAEGEIADARQKAAVIELKAAEIAAQERAKLLEAQREAWEQAREAGLESATSGGNRTGAISRIKLPPTRLPVFSGCMRDFHRWRKDWESLQRQGDPSGSPEVKKLHLLESIDRKVFEELKLSSYRSAEDVFKALENRFGDKATIALQIIEELERIPAVKGNQPRKAIDLIQAVERALMDLTDLGEVGAMKNPLVLKAIESKLPDRVQEGWITFVTEPENQITPDKQFDALLLFLKRQEVILERMARVRGSTETSERAPEKPVRWEKKAFTRATEKDSPVNKEEEEHQGETRVTGRSSERREECDICGSDQHGGKIFFCRKFKSLSLAEKRAIAKQSKACQKCLGMHGADGECSNRYLCRTCKQNEGGASHHYLLCPKWSEGKKTGPGLSDKQREVLDSLGLNPEQEKRVKDAFTSKASMTLSTGAEGGSLFAENGPEEHPVLMMILTVKTEAGHALGTLIDLASDTNYITNRAADRLQLERRQVTLTVHGVGGMKVKIKTNKYLLKVRAWSNNRWSPHEMVCYGLDTIARADKVISPERLCKFFPGVEKKELVRPEEIELLISHREGRLAPRWIRRTGDLVLWDGPLGKTVGGTHPDLFESWERSAHNSQTHFARSLRTEAVRFEEIPCKTPSAKEEDGDQKPQGHEKTGRTAASSKEVLEWWSWDSIGAACEPKCGGCRCGNCQPGGKEMTLAEEKEVEIIKKGLTYVMSDDHSDLPHWDTEYPWTEDPSSLPNNRGAVEATFRRTEKRLERDPVWKAAYAAQVHEMIQRGAAVELNEETISKWDGPVWYVSHQIAPNPHSASTPVRLVWNSSQEFRGTSLNSILLKGPDVLNPIRAVLLRFRTGEHAAIGDIRKMYNSVWLREREVHLHRFLWRDTAEEKIKTYAITRVNIGDKPAGCIAQLAMRETARLPEFAHLKEERRALEEDTYVDDILTSHNDRRKLKSITEGIERILNAGGFALKPWIQSGQSGRSKESQPAKTKANMEPESEVLVLPNQLSEEDNKALGVGYHAEGDKLFLMVSINFSKKKLKVRTETNLSEEEIEEGTPSPLTRRELLSQVAGLYDPVGLATPVKEKGAILVRKAFQEMGKSDIRQNTWDNPLPLELRADAIRLFKEYARLGKVRFERSLTPPGWERRPWGITFSDGSDNAFGAVLYLRWETSRGVAVRLVESKAKLTPITQKGDVVKSELCGAVIASRLKGFWEKQGRLGVERWFHFVDSQTVLGAIQKESYGYQTFYANRIGEIQRAGPTDDWWWIPGDLNVSDLVTRGCPPESLGEGSTWQNGPEFLAWAVEKWPMKSAADVAASARDSVSKLQRKAFTAAVTRAQARKGLDPKCAIEEEANAKGTSTPVGSSRDPEHERERLWGAALMDLIEPERFGEIGRLIRVVGWVRRAVKQWLFCRRAPEDAKWEATRPRETRSGVSLGVQELNAAFRDLCLAAQDGIEFPKTTWDRLVVKKVEGSGLLVCSGRIQEEEAKEVGIPLVPYTAWISTLLAREAHKVNHEGLAGTLLKMRKKAWVIQGQRAAWKVVNACVPCRKVRAKRCQQMMSDLPRERTEPAAPFEYTSVDLFGPYEVIDVVKRRTKLKVWGVVFSCMASRAVHADMVESLSTECFLKTYFRFTAIRGHPRKMWSDQGTNFVGAQPALKALYDQLGKVDRKTVEDRTARHGTEWAWVFHPADAPHRNGAAEASVRLLKRALSNVGRLGNLTCLEFQTALFLAADLVNERPIGAKLQVRDDAVEVVTPNTLLRGRAGDPGTFDLDEYPFVKLRAVQEEVGRFWRQWSQLAGPGLFIRTKWHREARNVAVGDVVWLADQNALRGQFRLGRVVEARPDEKGLVRDVRVRVCLSQPAPGVGASGRRRSEGRDFFPTLDRDVRRVVVLLPVEEQ